MLLQISVSIFEFADLENTTINVNVVSISCTELKSVQFWFIFLPNFGYHSNSIGSLENSSIIFQFTNSL